jgi:hypothetical protein
VGLDETFEADFVRYQPELKFLDFLRKQKREEFEEALKTAFEQYLIDKIATWSKDAQRDIDQAFIELAHSAFKHGESYSYLTDQINQKAHWPARRQPGSPQPGRQLPLAGPNGPSASMP